MLRLGYRPESHILPAVSLVTPVAEEPRPSLTFSFQKMFAAYLGRHGTDIISLYGHCARCLWAGAFGQVLADCDLIGNFQETNHSPRANKWEAFLTAVENMTVCGSRENP